MKKQPLSTDLSLFLKKKLFTIELNMPVWSTVWALVQKAILPALARAAESLGTARINDLVYQNDSCKKHTVMEI